MIMTLAQVNKKLPGDGC